MSRHPDVNEFLLAEGSAESEVLSLPKAGFETIETHWGYIVRGSGQVPLMLIVMQGLAWTIGVAAVLAGFGLWVLPASMVGSDVLGLKVGVSAVLFGAAALLLLFAGRGQRPEIEIDLSRGEVREVWRNRSQRASVVGRYGFDAIGGVFIDRTATHGELPPGHGWLVLRYRNTAKTLPVVAAHESRLGHLRDWIGRDLLIDPGPARRRAPVAPMPVRPAV